MAFRLIGQVLEAGDPQFGRIEIAFASGPAYSGDVGHHHVVYVSKYRSGQLGERSVGMSADAAREVARLLNAAADAANASPR